MGFWTDVLYQFKRTTHFYTQNVLVAPNFKEGNLKKITQKKEFSAEIVGLKYVLLSNDVKFC
jgi:hypothetical protein